MSEELMGEGEVFSFFGDLVRNPLPVIKVVNY